MSTFSSDRPRRKVLPVLALVIVAAALVAGGLYLRPRFESEPPRIAIAPDGDMVGTAPVEIKVSDAATGLKSLKVTLTQGGTEHD